MLMFFYTLLPDLLLVLILSIFSGYELNVFRKLGGITSNKNMMTGDTKNSVDHLYKALVDHKKSPQVVLLF